MQEVLAALEDMPTTIDDIDYHGSDESAYYSESNDYNTDILITSYCVKDTLSFLTDVFRPAI